MLVRSLHHYERKPLLSVFFRQEGRHCGNGIPSTHETISQKTDNEGTLAAVGDNFGFRLNCKKNRRLEALAMFRQLPLSVHAMKVRS